MRGASFPSRRLREKRRETTENDDWRRREDSCNSPGRAIEPALLSLQPSTTFDLFDQSCKHRDLNQRPLSQPVDQFSPNIISLPLSSSKVANFELHYIEFYKEFSEIQEWIPISLFSFSTIFESINFSLPLSIQNSQFRITLHEIVLPFHPRKSCSPDGCTAIYHHRVFSIHDFPPIFDLPCTVRRFLLLSDDRHSLGRRTREEKELSLSPSRRRRRSDSGKRDEMCVSASAYEGGSGTCWTSRCHWPEPASSRKRRKRASGKRWGPVESATGKKTLVPVLRHWFSLLYMYT